MMRKAMNINIKKGGDDLFQNRLFSYLSKELSVKIQGIKQLRGNVFLVQSRNLQFIVKGFNDLRKLKTQEAFSSSLRKSGFDQSYCFYKLSSHTLFFQNEYLGCMEFIEPDPVAFHYENESDRIEGMNLLHSFHTKTRDLAPSYSSLLPRADMARKWQQRKKEFTKNLPRIHHFIAKEMTDDFIQWSDFSLTGFIRLKETLNEEKPVILHGDVAHHNFLRSRQGRLYLIDYDLISIGSSANDMLQYANRILPFLNWELDALREIKHINNWLNYEAFLYGLMYPADILREWNRLLRSRDSDNMYRVAPIIEMTISQYDQRRRFQEEIKSLLKE
jgi:thiamine kinase-like enzyme